MKFRPTWNLSGSMSLQLSSMSEDLGRSNLVAPEGSKMVDHLAPLPDWSCYLSASLD